MHTLVIGGLGFIGHALCSALKIKGHSITTIDNINDYGLLDKSELNKLSTMRMEAIGSGVMHYRMDINQRQDITQILDSIDYDLCIFLAAYPRLKAVQLNVALAQETMVTSLNNLLTHARGNDKRFVYVSSSMVYGHSESDLSEDAILHPQTLYGKLKLTGELSTRHMVDDHLIIRPTGVYGPRDVTDRVISQMMAAAIQGRPLVVNGSATTLDVTYIDDVINGMMLAIESGSTGTYNISSGRSITLYELAESIIKTCNSASTIMLAEHDHRYPRSKTLDYSKASNHFRYRPNIDLMQGLNEYHLWLRNFLLG